MNVCDVNTCSGCGACIQVCPKNSIAMIEDDFGFVIPSIDENKCINCGSCKDICPSLNNTTIFLEPKSAFAFQALSNDRKIQKESASGGAFTYIAEKVINKNGVVFGCSWTDSFKAEHICITDKQSLNRLQKSKYIQSNTKDTFEQAKTYLDNGILVLFSGTPCQIAGLKSYLKDDYSNLITVDVVCHGVPSQKLFDDYLMNKRLTKKKKLIELEFRTTNPKKPKYDGNEWWKDNSNSIQLKPLIWQNDSYYSAFMYGLSYRESCYKCVYAKRARVADITVGDLWGAEQIVPGEDDSYGISLVLVNTDKGMKWFLSDYDKEYCVKINIEDACKHNGQLNHPQPKPAKREEFLWMWRMQGYKAVDDQFRRTYRKRRWIAIAVYYFPYGIKKKIKKLMNMK